MYQSRLEFQPTNSDVFIWFVRVWVCIDSSTSKMDGETDDFESKQLVNRSLIKVCKSISVQEQRKLWYTVVCDEVHQSSLLHGCWACATCLLVFCLAPFYMEHTSCSLHFCSMNPRDTVRRSSEDQLTGTWQVSLRKEKVCSQNGVQSRSLEEAGRDPFTCGLW